MAVIVEETTLKEVEATVVTIVPTTEHTMVMEAILMVETAVDARAQKLDVVAVIQRWRGIWWWKWWGRSAQKLDVVEVEHTTVVGHLVVEMEEDAQAQKLDVVEVAHTTVAGHLVVEMEVDVAVVAQETAEDKVRMVVEVVARGQDR
jgi:hypothetical protein